MKKNVETGSYMMWRYGLVVALIGILCGVAGAQAAEPLHVVTIQLQPFGFLDGDTPTGLHYELSTLIVEHAGLEATNRLVPYARVMKEFEDGTADMVVMYTNAALEEFAMPVLPVITYANIILGPAGTHFASLEELRGKRVAQVRGSLMDAAFAADEAIQKFNTDDYEQSLKMLFAGRVHAVIGSDIGLYSSLKAIGHTSDETGEPLVLNTTNAYLHLSKAVATDALITALQKAVSALQEEGTVDALRDRYMFQE